MLDNSTRDNSGHTLVVLLGNGAQHINMNTKMHRLRFVRAASTAPYNAHALPCDAVPKCLHWRSMYAACGWQPHSKQARRKRDSRVLLLLLPCTAAVRRHCICIPILYCCLHSRVYGRSWPTLRHMLLRHQAALQQSMWQHTPESSQPSCTDSRQTSAAPPYIKVWSRPAVAALKHTQPSLDTAL
jgi:hypothetical protein